MGKHTRADTHESVNGPYEGPLYAAGNRYPPEQDTRLVHTNPGALPLLCLLQQLSVTKGAVTSARCPFCDSYRAGASRKGQCAPYDHTYPSTSSST
jgi:hypothetical protein